MFFRFASAFHLPVGLAALITAAAICSGSLKGDPLFYFNSHGQTLPENWYPTQNAPEWNENSDLQGTLSYTSPTLSAAGSLDSGGYHYESSGNVNTRFNRGIISSNLNLAVSTTDLRPGIDAGYAIATSYTDSSFSDTFTVAGLPNGTPVQLLFTIFLKGEVGSTGGGQTSGAGILTNVTAYTVNNLYGPLYTNTIQGSDGLSLLSYSPKNGRQTDSFTYDTYAGLTGTVGYSAENNGSVDTFGSYDPPNPEGIATGPKIPYSSAFANLEAGGFTVQVLTPGAAVETGSGLAYDEDPTAIPENTPIELIGSALGTLLTLRQVRKTKSAAS